MELIGGIRLRLIFVHIRPPHPVRSLDRDPHIEYLSQRFQSQVNIPVIGNVNINETEQRELTTEQVMKEVILSSRKVENEIDNKEESNILTLEHDILLENGMTNQEQELVDNFSGTGYNLSDDQRIIQQILGPVGQLSPDSFGI